MSTPTTTSFSPQDLAACAAALLLIDDAKLYGLIDGGPEVDRERCGEILAKAEAQGIVPEREEISAKAVAIMVELGAVRQ